MGRGVLEIVGLRGRLRQAVATGAVMAVAPVALGGCNGTPPTASFTMSPSPAHVGETVTFDASASTPGDKGENCYSGNIIEHYDWDFDGDGTVDVSTTTPVTTHSYSSAGVRAVTLTVTNTCGLSDSATQALTVLPAGTASTSASRSTSARVPSAKSAQQGARRALLAAGVPVNITAPVARGTAKVGRLLAVDRGLWKGTRPISYQYQWSGCAAGRCVDIQGATGRTYRVLLGDVGSRLRLVVTARNRVGKAVAVSEATALVLPAVPVPRAPALSLP
jgi:PKD domain-containing protein